jgi:hypothetical protein
MLKSQPCWRRNLALWRGVAGSSLAAAAKAENRLIEGWLGALMA